MMKIAKLMLAGAVIGLASVFVAPVFPHAGAQMVDLAMFLLVGSPLWRILELLGKLSAAIASSYEGAGKKYSSLDPFNDFLEPGLFTPLSRKRDSLTIRTDLWDDRHIHHTHHWDDRHIHHSYHCLWNN